MLSDGLFTVEGLPPDAPRQLRRRIGLDADAPVRLSYIPGPGDLAGTYNCWLRGEHDPRVPIITYSAQFFELAKRLGLDTQILTQMPVPSEQMDASFIFRTVHRRNWNSRSEFFAAQTEYGNAVCAEVDAFAPHIVLVATDFPSAYWSRLAQEGRCLVLSAHNTFWPMGQRLGGLKGIYRRARLAWEARSLDDAICTSLECARQIATLTFGRVQGLTQLPQMAERHPVKRVSRVRNLLYLGRIKSEKGIFMLLDAFSALQPEFPDIRLVFAGAGSAATELESRLDQLGDQRISFIGRLDGPGVHLAIDGADLLICPTRTAFNEGLAVVGFEAAAHGVPTLMSSIVPAIDALGDGCAVFEADDQNSLVSTLRNLMGDEGRITARARNWEECCFGFDIQYSYRSDIADRAAIPRRVVKSSRKSRRPKRSVRYQ